MEAIWHEEELNSEFPLKEETLSPKALLLSHCYEGMQQLFSPTAEASTWWIPSKLRFGFASSLVVCHLGTLLRHGLDETWLFRGVFDVLSLTRVDIQLSNLSSFETWAGLCVALPLALAISIGVGSWLACPERALTPFFSFPFRALLITLCEVLPIPFLLTLADIAFQPIMQSSYYGTVNIATQLLAIPSLCSFCVMFLMYTVGSVDPRHLGTLPSLASRASSVTEMRAFWLRLSALLFFVLSRQRYPSYFAAYVCVTEAYLVRMYFWCRPFYNDTGNIIRSSTSSCLVVASVGYLVALYSNTSTVIAMMGCVTPVVVWLLCWGYVLVQPQREPIEVASIEGIWSANQLELRLRPYLATSEHANEVLSVCASYLAQKVCSDHRLIVAWVAGYCLHILDDAKLAKLKLVRSRSTPFSFEGSFQVHLVKRMLEARDQVPDEDSYHVKYLMSIETIKDAEQALSNCFCEILREVEAYTPSAATVFKLWKQLQEEIDKITKFYEELVKEYSFCQELLDMYASFLLDVLHYNESKVEALTKSCKLNRREPSSISRSYFDAELGVLVLSCNPETFGKILYINFYVGELVNFTCSDLIGEHLTDIVPSPMSIECLNALESLFINPQNAQNTVPKHALLRTKEDSLIEVVMEVSVIAVSNDLYFLGKILKSTKERDVLLVNSDLKVIDSTVSAAQELGYETIKGRSLYEVFPDVDFTEKTNKSLFSEHYDALSCVWKQRSCARCSYSLLYIYNNNVAECAFDLSSFFGPSKSNGISIVGADNEAALIPKSSKREAVEEMSRNNRDSLFLLEKMDSTSSDQASSSTQLHVLGLSRRLGHLKSALISQLLVLAAALLGLIIYQQTGLDSSLLFRTFSRFVSIQQSLAEISSDTRNLMMGLGEAKVYQDRLISNAAILSDIRELREECQDILDRCELVSAFTEDLPVWHTLGTPEVQWETLEQFLESIQLAVDSLVYSSDPDAYSFLVFNSFDHGFLQMKTLKTAYATCVMQEVDTFLFIYVACFGALALLLIAIAAGVTFNAFKIRKRALKLFESNAKLLLQCSSAIRTALINRMAMLGRDPSQFDQVCSKNSSGRISFPLMEYSWRPMVTPVLTVAMFVWAYFHYVQTLANTVDARVDLDMHLSTARVNLVQLEYWTREQYFFDTTDSLANTFSLCPSRPPSIELGPLRGNIKKTLHTLLKKRNDFFLSTAETELIFGNRNNRGLYELTQLSLGDSLEVLTTGTSMSLQEYIVELQELTQDCAIISQATEDSALELLKELELYALVASISVALLIFGVSVYAALGLVKQELVRLELQKSICQRLES